VALANVSRFNFTLLAAAPGEVSILTLAGANSSAVVRWAEPTDGGVELEGYFLHYMRGFDASTTVSSPLPASAEITTVGNLTNGVELVPSHWHLLCACEDFSLH
jgi:hypothetical protein